MTRIPFHALCLAWLLRTPVAQAQPTRNLASPLPVAQSAPARNTTPPAPPTLSGPTPVTDGIGQGGETAARSGSSLSNEDWLTRPLPKPKVGVYHSCRLYVPEDAQQARQVDRAEPVSTFRNPHDAGAAKPDRTEVRNYLWCREAAGERGVDLLANHDDAVSRTLGYTLQAHRLLEQTISLDLEIGQKRAALNSDLKLQVAQIRDDMRKEIAANAAQRTWTIAGWSIAGAFFLTTVALTTYAAVR